jgi:hypothetical protein
MEVVAEPVRDSAAFDGDVGRTVGIEAADGEVVGDVEESEVVGEAVREVEGEEVEATKALGTMVGMAVGDLVGALGAAEGVAVGYKKIRKREIINYLNVFLKQKKSSYKLATKDELVLIASVGFIFVGAFLFTSNN